MKRIFQPKVKVYDNNNKEGKNSARDEPEKTCH